MWQEIGDPPNPADPKYQDDYVALSIASAGMGNRPATSHAPGPREVRDHDQATSKSVSPNLVADHKERVARFKTKVKDFDEVMAKATLPVAPHVERLLLESKKSERLGYVLAKNQAKLAQLNRMNPEAAAREIGRLEGRLSLPQQPKTQTQARKPITPLKGGGASPPSQTAGRQRLHQEAVWRSRLIRPDRATSLGNIGAKANG